VELCNTLNLRTVDRQTISAAAGAHVTGYVAQTWWGDCPGELVAAYASAHSAMDDAPHGEEPRDDWTWDPTRVRDQAGRWTRLGYRWVTTAAVHETSGDVAGYTQLLLTGRPTTAVQEDTGVVRAHRGHGLGRVLKCANLLSLLETAPEIRAVVTWNAESNRHMTAVNDELGFRTNSRWNEVTLDL
jgi:GNAT superfamily N-acetyltransferase